MVDLSDFIPKNLSPNPQKNTLSEYLKTVVNYTKNINKKPVFTQFSIGGGCGLILGYVFSKTSRFISIAIGVSIVITQYFIHKGYIRFNETRIEKDVRNLKESVLSELGVNNSLVPSQKDMDKFLKKNLYVFSGFIAGTFLGYGFS